TIGEGNVISGNRTDGVLIEGKLVNRREQIATDRAHDNLVVGNIIGLDHTGSMRLGNGKHGVQITFGAYLNTIGDIGKPKRNIISGNLDHQVQIHGAGSDTNTVQSNYIGTDVTGLHALWHAGFFPGYPVGVGIEDGAQDNVVGGFVKGTGNVIAAQD